MPSTPKIASSMLPGLSKGKLKKAARAAAVATEKQRAAKLHEVAKRSDLLEPYEAFRLFSRQGVEAALEGCHGLDLLDSDIDACIAFQRRVVTDPTMPFDEEAARGALRHEESRVLLMRALPPRPTQLAASPEPIAEDSDEPDEWDMLPEADDLGLKLARLRAPALSEADAWAAEARAAEVRAIEGTPEPGGILGYLHLQFCVAPNRSPMLCVLNMQLTPVATGKGLGKHALQLVELMALQNGMELVMMYHKDGAVQTVRLSSRNKASTKQCAAPRSAPVAAAEAPTKLGDEAFEIIQWPSAALVPGRPVSVNC